MKRQQIKESIDVHGHDAVLAGLLVHLVVIGDSPLVDIEYPGISDGHTVCIASDVFEHLTDSFGRGLCMNDPWLVEALLTDGLGDDNSLFLQPACQQIHETSPESGTHSSHGEEEGRTSASMNLVPYSPRINASTGHNTVNMGVVKEIRSPRMENGGHASEQSLLGSKCINGGPCSLEHAVVELPLIRHRDRMQAVGQREHDMEILGGDDFLPAELNPLLTLLVLTLGTMAVTTTVVADSDLPALRTHLYMSAKGTGSALRHVPESSFDRRNDMMLTKELSSMDSDNLADVEACSHLGFGGKIVSISLTCFIGSISAT